MSLDSLFQKAYTLILLKPDAVQAGATGAILERIEKEDFTIRGLKRLTLTKAQAQSFYAVHKDRPFFDELTSFMASGPIVAAVIEREQAVEHWRKVIGATDPAEAEEGTIRKQFAKSKGENAVHGSDSAETAAEEAQFFFSQMELV